VGSRFPYEWYCYGDTVLYPLGQCGLRGVEERYSRGRAAYSDWRGLASKGWQRSWRRTSGMDTAMVFLRTQCGAITDCAARHFMELCLAASSLLCAGCDSCLL